MIPLSLFLIAWVILLGIHLLMSFISVVQMLRFGIAGVGTTLSTALFVGILALAILGTGLSFLAVDWQQPVNILDSINSSPYLLP